jgi:hypothetical protein
MNMKKIDAISSVYFNGDFFKLQTMSRRGMRYADPDVEPFYLLPDAENQILGQTLRLALSKSKEVSVEKFDEIFKSGIVQEKLKEENKKLMKQYGYKTKRALYKNMNCCWISVYEGKIEIKPTHHDSIDGYSGISNDGPEILYLPVTATDEELGAALREGLSRCTSVFK